MTINEKRVSNNLHCWTCKKVKQKEDMIQSNASKFCIICCSGAPHKSRDDIEGPIEKYPKRLIKKIVLFKPAQVFILIIFTVYLGISIWGTTSFKEGLDIRNLVGSESYFYKFYDADQTLFGQSLVVSLNIQSEINYRQGSTFNDIESLITNVRNDYQVVDDFLISWLHSYRSSDVYANSTDDAFMVGLQIFLDTTEGNIFINDVMIDTAANSISASRCYIRILSMTSSTEQGNMMVRIRDIVNSSPLPVFAYSPSFILYEQYVQIVPQTLQTLGICVGVVFVVTAIFMPLPLVILLVTMTVVMIMVGVIGFIHFWGLTLSSVTMIQIIMCVGFCIDFSTHICHAFVQAGGTRNERVSQALHMAGGPIFNGAISTILGALMLAFSSSYIFISFLKIIFLVMVFGFVHAMFLLPVVLAYIGPHYTDDKAKTTTSNEKINLCKVHCEGKPPPEPAPDYPGAEKVTPQPDYP